jgi:hypothetical protein
MDVIPDAAERQAFIRNLTGGLDSRALGVGPTQRALEGFYLAFSPRLLRSTVALVGDLSKGLADPRGRAAAEALSKLVAGTTGLYVVTGLALGKDWEEIKTGLNPLKGKRFLSHEVNGDWIGVGGQVRAITQLLAHMAANYDNPEAFASADIQENPLLAAYASRGAPALNIVGGTVEATTGLDAAPYDDINGPRDLLKHLGTSALPFVLQGILEGEAPLTSGAAMVGARTSAGTVFEEQRQAIKEDDEAGLFTGDYKVRPTVRGQLTREDKAGFDSRHAELVAAVQQAGEEMGGDQDETRYFNLKEHADETLARELDRVHGRARAGGYGSPDDQQARSKLWDAMQEAETERVGAILNLQTAPDFKGVIEKLEGGGLDSRQEELLNAYFDLQARHAIRETDEDWDAYEQDLARTFSDRELAIIERELAVGQHELQGLWDGFNKTLRQSGYYDVPEGRAQSRRREIMRRQNPELDAALYLLGRVSRTMTSRARGIVTQRTQEIWGGGGTTGGLPTALDILRGQ